MATDRERLSIDIDHSLGKELDKIPWGLKSEVIRTLLRHLADLMQREGTTKVIYLVLNNDLKIPERLIEQGKRF